MGRIDLFEFEDQSWFPQLFRNFGTDFLRFLANKTQMYKPIIPIIEKGIDAVEVNQIIDVASGSTGGLLGLNDSLLRLFPDLLVHVTDYYPNLPGFEYINDKAFNFDYVDGQIDARNIPKELWGFRTLFLAFHHFNPKDAVQVLQDAVDKDVPIGIFEAQERRFLSILGMLFSPITVLLTTPFIMPFSWKRYFFTYIIPIVPLFVLWDGVASCFRTYSVAEMKALVKQVKNQETYDWEIERIKSGPGVILYLLGRNKDKI